MGFLPENYEAPQSGNYMKIQPGENRIRVLGAAIVGNMFWTDEGGQRKPVRRRVGEAIHPDELGFNDRGEREKVRHFWAFPVWNYTAKQVQILELTQATVREGILSLVESEDWGDPTGYDLLIKKSGANLETKYSVMPGKQSPIPTEAQREYVNMAIDMEALFRGDDPFSDAPADPPHPDPSPLDSQPDTLLTEIGEVKTTESKAGTVYHISTPDGSLGTLDAKVGEQARTIAGNRRIVELVYVQTAKGRRLDAINVPPAGGAEDDLPFAPDRPRDFL